MDFTLQIFEKTLARITGDKPFDYYLAGMFFSFIGVLVSIYHSSKKRDPNSPNTPQRWSFIFMLWDNAKRIFITMIVMFVLFRVFPLDNVLLMLGVGVIVTIALDKVIEFLMSQSERICRLFSMNRENWPEKPKDDENNKP